MKNILEGSDYKNLQEITIKYQSDHRKHRYELLDKPKKQSNRIFLDEKLVIVDCRTTAAHKFRTIQCILPKEQSVLMKIKSLFQGENMQIQHSVLSYRINLYFPDYKLAIKIDENGQNNRNIDYKIKRQQAIKQ